MLFRSDEAQFARQLPPDAGNASHERRALAIIDKTDKAIANLKPQRRAIGNIFPVDLRGVLHFWRLGRVTFLRLCRSLAQPPGSVAGDTSGGGRKSVVEGKGGAGRG